MHGVSVFAYAVLSVFEKQGRSFFRPVAGVRAEVKICVSCTPGAFASVGAPVGRVPQTDAPRAAASALAGAALAAVAALVERFDIEPFSDFSAK